MDSGIVLAKAKEYRDYTARNLSEMVKVPGFSTTEKERILLLKRLCEEAGMEDLRIDGLGSLLGRVGKGSKKLGFDAHSGRLRPIRASSGTDSSWGGAPPTSSAARPP